MTGLTLRLQRKKAPVGAASLGLSGPPTTEFAIFEEGKAELPLPLLFPNPK